jgi:hypothetical protein
MNFKFEGFRGKLYKRKSMVEAMCDAFKTGIGPVGRERRTRMMLLQKKTGSLLIGKGKVGGGDGTKDRENGEKDADRGDGGDNQKEEEEGEAPKQKNWDKLRKMVKKGDVKGNAKERDKEKEKEKETEKKAEGSKEGGGGKGGGKGWEKLRRVVKGGGDGGGGKSNSKSKNSHKGKRDGSDEVSNKKKEDKAKEGGNEDEIVMEEKKEDGVEEGGNGEALRMGLRRDQTVVIGDTLGQVINIMAAEKKGRVYVTNSAGRPVGVVTIHDICRLILNNCEAEVVKLLEAKDDDEEEEDEEGGLEEGGVAKQEEIEKRIQQSKEEEQQHSNKAEAGAMIDKLLARPTMTGVREKEGTAAAGSEKVAGWVESASEIGPTTEKKVSLLQDQRPSISVLYEMNDNKVDIGGGGRIRADTGQLEDVITLPATRNRMASLVLEEGEEDEEDDEE